jgi:glycosyltransferase involved in cell wall biosynthesis
MKVLHVCESIIGGPASYLEETLPFQVEAFTGQNVILLAPESQRGYLPADLGCIIETYPRRGRNPQSLLALATAILRNLRRHDPDIVHLHSTFAGAAGRLVTRGLRHDARIVYCAHGWSFDRIPRTALTRVWILAERLLATATDIIVNLSPHEEKLLRETGFAAAKTRLVVTGLRDLPRERRITRPARAARGALKLLFLGRLDVQKGADLLLREFMDIPPERATLTIAGGKVVGNAGIIIPPGVDQLGWIARDTVPELLVRFDAVLMPSRWEGMPIAAIEAMRSGRPLIGSSHGVFPHIIRDGVNGVLIDIAKQGFMQHALDVLERADLAAMGAAARTTYESLFDNTRMNRQLIELYGDLVMRPRRAGERRAVLQDVMLPAGKPTLERVRHKASE